MLYVSNNSISIKLHNLFSFFFVIISSLQKRLFKACTLRQLHTPSQNIKTTCGTVQSLKIFLFFSHRRRCRRRSSVIHSVIFIDTQSDMKQFYCCNATISMQFIIRIFSLSIHLTYKHILWLRIEQQQWLKCVYFLSIFFSSAHSPCLH